MPVLLSNIGPVWGLIAGVGLLIFILMRRSYGFFSKRRRRLDEQPLALQPRPKGPWDGAQHDAQALIDRQEVEMFEMARDLNGQLSSRIIVLEKLIADSQQQIDRMESLLTQIEAARTDTATAPSLE